MLAGQLDGHAFVVGGGVKAATFGAAAVVDRAATEDLGQPLERDIVAGIDEAVAQRWSRDVAAIKRRHGHIGKWVDDEIAQALLADILVQHPEEMTDAGASAVA